MMIWRKIARSFICCLIFFLSHPFLGNSAWTGADTLQSEAPQPPETIHVWYGTEQHFGFPGLAQRWINIPGHVDNHEQLASLSFTVNDGPEQTLSIGPDARRLARAGEFNVEIDAEELRPGNNTLSIIKSLKDNSREVKDVAIHYRIQPWPLPYRVDWSAIPNIQETVQVVDGLWQLTDSGLRTAPGHITYDRSLALGDASWSSYEILVGFTVNSVDYSAYGSPESVSPGLGLILHWNGHTDTPVDCGQPHCGWFPAGAIHWYSLPENEAAGFSINTRPISDLSVKLPYPLTVATGYLLRCRVQVFPFRTHYALKIWQEGEEEPDEWSLQRTADRKNPGHGGVLLVAHHLDLTFSTIEVREIIPEQNLPISEYLRFLPQILTMAAALLFLGLTMAGKQCGARNRIIIVVSLLAALTLFISIEPLLPIILERFSFDEKMSAALYIGYDFSYTLLQILIWIVILFNSSRKREQKRSK